MAQAKFAVRVTCMEQTTEQGESLDPCQLMEDTSVNIEITDPAGAVVWGAWVDVIDPLADPITMAREAADDAGWELDGVDDEWQPNGNGAISTTGVARRADPERIVSRHAFFIPEFDGEKATPMLLLSARRASGDIVDCGSIMLTDRVVDDLRNGLARIDNV